MSEGNYIQGAGDDSEGWSHGLTPAVFWQNKEQYLSAVEEELLLMIPQTIGGNTLSVKPHDNPVKVGSTNLFIGNMSEASRIEAYDAIIVCNDTLPASVECNPVETSRKVLHLLCSPGKLGSRALRSNLHRVPPFITSLCGRSGNPKILVACSTSQDLAIGITLVLLCLFYDEKCKIGCNGLFCFNALKLLLT